MTTPQPPKRKKKRRRRLNPFKVLRMFLPVMFFIAMCVVMCVPSPDKEEPAEIPAVDETVTLPADERKDEPSGSREASKTAGKQESKTFMSLFSGKDVYDLERADTVSYHLRHLDRMPEPTQRIKVNYFGNLRPYFNDSNYKHWAEAERYGIRPLTDTRSHWQLPTAIVKVTTCEDFYLDTLIFSRPFLVPQAASRLHEIGRRFRDTIDARGGGDYRIKVTSLLRTPATIRRLRRRNRNAIDSSVHQLGTTFDISYASFVASSPAPARSVDDLKGILAEVLKAMREEGKIYVKYEVGQPCFHITARKPDKE